MFNKRKCGSLHLSGKIKILYFPGISQRDFAHNKHCIRHGDCFPEFWIENLRNNKNEKNNIPGLIIYTSPQYICF